MVRPRLASSPRSAFTLLELLVVVTVIALLVAMLMSSLSAARARSQATVCLTRMSQIARATLMYAQDSRDYFPRSQHSAAAHQQRPWGQVILKHLGIRSQAAKATTAEKASSGLYRCPADRRENWWSYGSNVYVELEPENDDYEGSPRTWHRVADIRGPTRTVFFGENKSSVDHFMAHFWTTQADVDVEYGRHAPRSRARSNYAYVDGHVQPNSLGDTFDPERKLDHWNPSKTR